MRALSFLFIFPSIPKLSSFFSLLFSFPFPDIRTKQLVRKFFYFPFFSFIFLKFQTVRSVNSSNTTGWLACTRSVTHPVPTSFPGFLPVGKNEANIPSSSSSMTCRTTTTTSTTALNLIATPSKPAFSVALAGKFPHNCPIKSRRLSRVRFRSPTTLNHERPNKRHCFVPKARYSSSSEAVELPLLPFPMDQVLVPSETKTLHLYEARYLALLDESLFGTNKHFVHFVLDPIGINDTAEASFAARYGCLVLIEKVERLDVGALVSIRGVGRVKIVKIVQEPLEALCWLLGLCPNAGVINWLLKIVVQWCIHLNGSKHVKFEFIANECVRRQTFRKRRAGLMKKVSELRTLCGVDACAVIYSTPDAQPDVCPSPPETYHVLESDSLQANPYLRGTVIPMQDVFPDSLSRVSFQVVELKEALHCLNGLEIKLKAPKEALMQTQIANAVKWAEKESSVESYGAFFPSSIERLSFAGLQPISGKLFSIFFILYSICDICFC
ncbi:hypothetical protein RHMOL_Rhmol11G0109300 [Rhododendron molle]|uniref:Uncharacterized protein n=1 Tax=Rhododendron molle TaxID=49168 RepID=A0ACC0LSG9_RHOML|nr:hypothetical protein RHMOL_Rhmol11G0109300 [Rhododendron molle]